MEKEVKTFDSEIKYTLDFRKVKYPRLEFRTGQLHLVLPENYKDKDKLLKNNKKWIKEKQLSISKALKNSKKKKLEKRNMEDLKKLIKEHYKNMSSKPKINKFYFRSMKSKWASLSSKKNITFNTKMKYLPDNLIKYILTHELAHIKEKMHNKRFWDLIENKFSDYRQKEKELFEYWFLINSKTN